MLRLVLVFSAVVSVGMLAVSCKEKPVASEVESASNAVEPTVDGAETSTQPEVEAKAEAAAFVSDAPKGMISELGEFGSPEPVERQDLPERGVLSFTIQDRNQTFMPGEHWEQYNFPFEARRWGRYRVRLTYTLKASGLGVQLKLGEQRVKKQLKHTGEATGVTFMGEVNIESAGSQFMALYTPSAVGWSKFILHEIALVPTQETAAELVAKEDGAVHLLAKEATTWSENMRYEPKPEKDCLGFWTDKEDFAEWEFKVDKAGRYEVIVHQGCGSGGGSQVAVELAGQQLEFKVEDTGGFQNWKPVSVGQVEIDAAGTYRLAVKPKTKEGAAIMDVHKVVLVPVS
jgi:hypothetical protein